jgi:hypothetical protein
MIHAVGRAADQAPRLLEMRWGKKGRIQADAGRQGRVFRHRRVWISSRPRRCCNMKKDMGGAANVLALAMMIMDAGLPVDLRVLVPAVENSIAASAFRPGDVLSSRKGSDRPDRQHRRRGPPGAGRCAELCLRGRSRPAHRHGDADRRCPGGAGSGPAAVLHRRRGTGRRDRDRLRKHVAIRSGGCRFTSPTKPM